MRNGNKVKSRLFIALLLVSVAYVYLTVNLFRVQVIKAEEYKKMALEQQTRNIPIPAHRGEILDRNGIKLAFNVKKNSIWINKASVENPEETLDEISKTVGEPIEVLRESYNGTKKEIFKLVKWIDKDVADAVRIKKLKGVWISDDIMRTYPYENFASHVIGHTRDDNKGLAGIEYQFDSFLKGVPGKLLINSDSSGRQLAYGEEKRFEPVDGFNVVVTIDEIIQYFLEKALINGMEETGAKSIQGIVMNIKTGEVLAMAKKPDYNPNTPRVPLFESQIEEYEELDEKGKVAYWNKMWRNSMISDTYEPGSTFKTITVAGALEENVIKPSDTFNDIGYIMVSGVRLNCWSWRHPHGLQTVAQAMQNSCNPVLVQIQQRLGKENFYKYIEGFGFTKKTGIKLPAEASSIMLPKEKLGPVEMGTISYGHGIAVTPIQLITAISADANDGELMKPRIVKELVDKNGNVIEKFEPEFVKKVVSEKTSKEVRLILESVINEGSGKNARIEGIRIGGKTGTSEKLINGKYSEEAAIASFYTVAPIEDPEIAILVVVDEPQNSHFGSVVGTPIVKEIMVDVFRYLKMDGGNQTSNIQVKLPDLRGLTVKKAEAVLGTLNLEYSVTPLNNKDDSLIIEDQFPQNGAMVDEHSVVILKVKNNEE
jgi:stage V sporulation protein D (sporulation-specific penicillin-binding protein)